MNSHRKTRVALALAGAAALVAAGGAAYASAPWTVAVGGDTTAGTVAYTTTATGTSSAPAIAITMGGSHMTCVSASSAGDVTKGATSGFFASITDFTLDSCLLEGVLPMELTVSATVANPWKVDITGDKTGNVSPIQIYDIHAHMRDIGTGGGTCAFDVDGTIDGTFDDSSAQQLAVNGGGLVVSNVTGGCFGLTNDGNDATFAGVFDVANAVGPITVDH